MSVCYLDTHVAVWLHDGLVEKLTQAAKAAIESSEELLISPIVYLEFDYLFKRGRVKVNPPVLFSNLSTTFGIQICGFSFPAVAGMAVDFDWTSDPFDRLIVANARANQNSRLVTADEAIRKHYLQAVW